MSRTWVYQKVMATPSLGVPGARVYSVGAVGRLGDTPDRPFIVIREMLIAPSLLPSWPVDNRPYQIWVHDDPGSMMRIDQAIGAVRVYLPEQAPTVFGDEEIFACEWNAMSDDLYDDHHKTNTRHADFTLKVKGGAV